jgi:uncharacterized protein
VNDARPPGTEPSDDPHLPDPDVEVPVEPPSPAWAPIPGTPGGAGAAPGDVPSRSRDAEPARSAVPSAAALAEAPGLDDAERPLAPKVVTAWRIGSLASLILPTVVSSTLGFVFLGGWGWVILGTLVALALFLTLWYAPARYARWRWQLTELAVELRFGVLVRQQETVPYFRIQQIDIVQGPLDRILDLATLQVTTASASGSAALPGIANDDAPTVRAELLARAAAAVAEHPGDLRDAV